MNIVHVEDFFHPDAGYQENVLSKFMAQKGHKVTIITSDLSIMSQNLMDFFGNDNLTEKDEKFEKAYGVKIVRIPIKMIISGRAIITKDFYNAIRKVSPDIVFVHGNDTMTGMRYLLNLKRMPYPLIMDSHMLEIASVNRFNKIFRLFYKATFSQIIKHKQIIVIRTQDNLYVKKCLGIPLELAPWISTGSDTTIFRPNYEERIRFRTKHHIDMDDFVVVYAGKLDEAKGGLFLAEALTKKFNAPRKFTFIIVGTIKGEYGDEFEKKITASQNQILRFPTQKYIDLPKYFQASDLCVFPRQCSLTFYDAQACGVPVLFEDNDVNRTRIIGNNAMLFKAGDMNDFRGKLEEVAALDKEEYRSMQESSIKNVKDNYDYSDITDQYLNIMNEVVCRYK